MWYKEYLDLIKIDIDSLDSKNSIELLEEIITNHQIFITYDTIRKYYDFKDNVNLKEEYFDISKYIRSVKKNGLGGTCFHLTWALYNLLCFLNFDVKILKLEYQHFALAVSIDSREYYIDVGFWSPLFKIYPLRENWKIKMGSISVEWKKSKEGFNLYWNNNIAKHWYGEFISVDTFFVCWQKTMNKKNYFLQNLYINKWLNKDFFIFLVNGNLKKYHKGLKIEEINFSSVEEALIVIENNFSVKIDIEECNYLLNDIFNNNYRKSEVENENS